MTQVGIFIGSISDEQKMRPCTEVLDSLGISYRFTVSSAHRTPERTARLVNELEQNGCQVFICAAGLAAHLAGAVAAKSIKPVLGVPISASSLGGWDALLSTVQMPPGYPVGTLALDKAGAKNAAWLAAQILALNDSEIEEKIYAARESMQESVEEAAKSLESQE
jgi:5-(carboxyamino)imidazole ribonucleotide mutase